LSDNNITKLEENTTININTQTEESFLSEVEYGKMLYNNPRGISCSQCHGKKGKGGHKIAKYYDQHKNPKILKGLDITGYSIEELKASLNNQYRDRNNHRITHKIMPIYYLTDKEVSAIYAYLQQEKG
jgi:mono/diheme cytochrome c family protein